MAYKIEINVETRTVWVFHSGAVDLIDMESGRSQAVALLTQQGYSRLMVDTRHIEQGPTLTEHHRFAASQPLYMPLHVAVAVLLRPVELKQPPPFERLSVERGVQMRAFTNLDEAQAWLMRITN
ncbi:MAG: hypothetical protein EOP38_04280 [Rubrivivax sp.]|nr:MAG: hypothetical protein EOP38_04280 [Rubrivivax sp.]